MEIHLRGTLDEILPVYEMFLKRAIRDMLSQESLEGCRECWSNWKSFQKDKLFIRAKDQMKEKFSNNHKNHKP